MGAQKIRTPSVLVARMPARDFSCARSSRKRVRISFYHFGRVTRQLLTALTCQRFSVNTSEAAATPSAQLQRLASSFRTAAAELPTLSTIFCNSARDTPSSLVQYFTSQLSCMLILLRSGVSLFVRLSISTPSNIFVDRQTRAMAWSIGRVLENPATLGP